MSQCRPRRRHPASGPKDLDSSHSLVPLTVAMDSIRLWSCQEESGGKKREEERSGETAERDSLSVLPPTVGG